MGSSISAGFFDKSDSWALAVLAYCSWRDRYRVFLISRKLLNFQRDDLFWKWMCSRLEDESSVYSPSVIPPSLTFKTLFKELYPLNQMWSAVEGNDTDPLDELQSGDKRKISVYARFCPRRPKADALEVIDENNQNENTEGKDDATEVTLPLHQRLAMIKMSHRLTNNRQALKVLTSEGGWFQIKWSNMKNMQNGENKTKGECFETGENVDINSLNQTRDFTTPNFGEKKIDREKIVAAVQTVDPATGRVVMLAPDVGLREFAFDGVFTFKANQKGVYNTVAKRLVCDFINGYNATVIVYGQTGSGKTYSMFGEDEYNINIGGENGKGIVPRACSEILAAMEKRNDSNLSIESSIGVSYVEVFGDQVSDLLKCGSRCGHSKVAAQRYVLQGAAEQPITSMGDVADILKRGALQKRRAATAMNERSTRAHSIFILTLHQRCASTNVERTSRLFLADLGGSEQVKKSKVEAGTHRSGLAEESSMGFELGDRMREAVYINLGLLALKKCIESLNSRALYTPYQDSKLTMLLSSGLGGDCKTSVMVCGSMDSSNASETVATMRFGERCALIETEARNKANMLAGVLRDIENQISDLEIIIKEKEKWGFREDVRRDAFFEENTMEAAADGMEVRKVFLLTGAEKERKSLEKLLHRRAEFTGQPLDVLEDDNTISFSTSATSVPGKKMKKVIAFGGDSTVAYGFGEKYVQEEENSRFEGKADVSDLPDVVRTKGGRQWETEDVSRQDTKKMEEIAKKIKRNKLMYSGLSL